MRVKIAGQRKRRGWITAVDEEFSPRLAFTRTSLSHGLGTSFLDAAVGHRRQRRRPASGRHLPADTGARARSAQRWKERKKTDCRWLLSDSVCASGTQRGAQWVEWAVFLNAIVHAAPKEAATAKLSTISKRKRERKRKTRRQVRPPAPISPLFPSRIALPRCYCTAAVPVSLSTGDGNARQRA